MATYIRYAHKARKIVYDLGTARDRVLVAKNIVAVTILDKGTGTFTLHFIFYDGTEFNLNQDELASGDRFMWDIQELRFTNATQTGLTVKLLIDYQRRML